MRLPSRRAALRTAAARPADSATAVSTAADSVAAVVGPAAIENTPRYLRIGDGYAATLIVTGYPAEVGPAWLDPL
ncbi:hypothetical protein AB0M20_37460, partial [Actinoplanes sp. NPDC051633]|uniref:hypothetical protein n=1 Tax=Actinoplanes sp. NPDC051633 TaxID=3155670 RepID=UPI003439A980